jgi:hypothetical protein
VHLRLNANLSKLERPAIAALLALILLGYVLATVRVILALPIGHGPDSVLHLQYVRFVADDWQLPVAVLPPENNAANQESVQPPLFYGVAAALTGWVTHPAIAQPVADLLARVFNWAAASGVSPGPPALYATPVDLWPQSTVVAGYAVSLVSLLAGLVALLLLFGLLQELSGSSWLALAGTAWLGWNFNYPYIHAIVSNDAFLALCVTAALWQAARVLRLSGTRAVGQSVHMPDRSLLWLGACLGILALVKLNGLVVLPVVGLALLWKAPPERRLRSVVLVGGVVVLVAGWWYLRNLWFYGEPTGLRMMAAIEGAKQAFYTEPLNATALWPVLTGAADALLFYSQRWLPLVVLNGLAFVGALVALGRRAWRFPIVVLVAIVLLVLPAYLAWAGRFTYGTAPRLLLPAWPALAGLWAIGFAAWLPRRLHPLVLLIVLPIMSLHLASVFGAKWPPRDKVAGYTFVPLLSTYDRPRVDQPFAVQFGQYLALTGSSLDHQGDQTIIALHWQLEDGIRDLQTAFYVHLVDTNGSKLAQLDTFYQTDSLPLPAWRRGQTVVCLYRFRVPKSTVGPLRVYTGVYSRDTMQTLPAIDAAGVDVPGGNLLIGKLSASGEADYSTSQ